MQGPVAASADGEIKAALCPASNFVPFSGSGQSLLDAGERAAHIEPDSAEQRREKVRQAALARISRTLKTGSVNSSEVVPLRAVSSGAPDPVDCDLAPPD